MSDLTEAARRGLLRTWRQITAEAKAMESVTPAGAAAAERAAIVAWLRTRDHVCAEIIADQVEKGKHLA
jgi:hypothetical protein